MQLRRQSSAVDAARIRNSFMEPALRLKHSLQEPLERLRHSMMEPNVIMNRQQHPAQPHHQASPAFSEPGFGKLNLSSTTTATTHVKVVKPATSNAVTASLGPIGTARRIIQREGFGALYKGTYVVCMCGCWCCCWCWCCRFSTLSLFLLHLLISSSSSSSLFLLSTDTT
jgi:hypothetical protein